MKKLNWKSIEPQKILQSSLWVKCQEESLATKDMFADLSQAFATKPSKIVVGKSSFKLSHQVLDGKTAQNVLIFKRGFVKGLTNEQIVLKIMKCDVSADVIEGLMQCLPHVDQMKRLCNLKETGSQQLSEAEELVVSLGSIQDLMPRLRTICFKQNFADLVEYLEPSMTFATLACIEIKSSEKLAKILELILTIGNYMNSASICGPAFGFEISFIAKIGEIKDSDNKRTLLHFLVDLIKQKHPHLLSLCDEMLHLKNVGNVHSERIQNDMLQMTNSFEELQFLLSKHEVQQSWNDEFSEKMGGFAIQCENKLEKLIKMEKQMENSYKAVADYFSFDPNEYQMEELFSDLSKFMSLFSQGIKDLKINPKNQKENSKICVNKKPKSVSYSASDDSIRMLCQRNLVIKLNDVSSEGLFSILMFSTIQLIQH